MCNFINDIFLLMTSELIFFLLAITVLLGLVLQFFEDRYGVCEFLGFWLFYSILWCVFLIWFLC